MKKTAASLGIHESTGFDWRKGTTLPFLARLYRTYMSLGELKPGCKWLPVRIARNGSAFLQLIQVPTSVGSEHDIKAVLHQFPSRTSIRKFGFLLGVMLGDAGKGMNLYIKGSHRTPSLNLHLVLSKNRESNERFARYTAKCSESLGLRMYRIADKASSEKQLKSKSKAQNYAWRSERSPFFGWIHVVCLGLDVHQTTTKTPVQMPWIVQTNRNFRIAFLQGVAESDGSVSYNGYARIETWPNAPFIASIIRILGATCSIYKKGERNAGVSLTVDQAASIHLFNEQVVSERYARMKKMTGAQRLRSWPPALTETVIGLASTMPAPNVTRQLLVERNIFIRPGSINRYLRKLKPKPPLPFS
jgi:hypothetical protein